MPSKKKFAILACWKPIASGYAAREKFIHEADGTPAAFDSKEAADWYAKTICTKFCPLNPPTLKVVPYPKAEEVRQ